MTFQLVDFDSVFTDSESDIDFTAERMDNLVEIDTALELDDEVLASFVEENKAKNTVNKTKSDLNMWYRWCEVVGETRKVENITDKTELNRLLSHFYMTVKRKMVPNTSQVQLRTAKEVLIDFSPKNVESPSASCVMSSFLVLERFWHPKLNFCVGNMAWVVNQIVHKSCLKKRST